MIDWLLNHFSSWLHGLFFEDHQHESLCSHAYRLRFQSRFWRFWVWVFGAEHCRKSYEYYWKGKT